MFCPTCHAFVSEPGARVCPDDGATLREKPRWERIPIKRSDLAGTAVGGRYLIRGLIGAGGMAQVYLAEDQVTDAPVAVKILRPDKTKDKTARARFFREMEIARAMRHPNVAVILDAGETAERSPFLVVEYLFGEPLSALLARAPALDSSFALVVAGQVASALSAAHQIGVVHRDVKPDNLILVGEPGHPKRVKVVDFGMAKLKVQNQQLTAAGVAVGTVAFMAPEQAVADEADARTDIYALGAVLFLMLAGRMPFECRTNAEHVAHHLFVPPPPVSSVVPGLSPGLDALILRAMRKNPDNRYGSMEELMLDIQRLMGLSPGAVTSPPLARVPDAYEPQNPIGKATAKALYAKLAAAR